MVLAVSGSPGLEHQAYGQADDAQIEAKALYELGKTHYRLAEYDAAIAAFKKAYAISDAPLLLYNIAQAYRLQDNCMVATRFYLNYLRLDPGGQKSVKASKHIETLSECVTKTAPALAAIPKPVARSPRRPARSEPQALQVAPSPNTDRKKPGRAKRIIGAVTGGAGLALLATSAYLGSKAQDDSAVIDAFNETGGTWTDELADIETRGQKRETQALILAGIGGTAVIGGAVLYYLGWRGDSRPTLTASAGSTQLSWSGRW